MWLSLNRDARPKYACPQFFPIVTPGQSMPVPNFFPGQSMPVPNFLGPSLQRCARSAEAFTPAEIGGQAVLSLLSNETQYKTRSQSTGNAETACQLNATVLVAYQQAVSLRGHRPAFWKDARRGRSR